MDRITPIDWDEIHRRMAMAAAALEQGFTPSTEEKKNILKVRAKALAEDTGRGEEPKECLEVVEFLLADERYGIESSYVREVYPLRELVPLPCTPPFILGITNVRGKILSVIDIRKFFDLPEKGLTELDKIIIVQANEMELGIRADAVLGIRAIALEEIQPPLPRLTGIRERYLKGVTKEQEAILDVAKLLSDKKIIVNEEVETQA